MQNCYNGPIESENMLVMTSQDRRWPQMVVVLIIKLVIWEPGSGSRHSVTVTDPLDLC